MKYYFSLPTAITFEWLVFLCQRAEKMRIVEKIRYAQEGIRMGVPGFKESVSSRLCCRKS